MLGPCSCILQRNELGCLRGRQAGSPGGACGDGPGSSSAGAPFLPFNMDVQRDVVQGIKEILLPAGPAELKTYR